MKGKIENGKELMWFQKDGVPKCTTEDTEERPRRKPEQEI